MSTTDQLAKPVGSDRQRRAAAVARLPGEAALNNRQRFLDACACRPLDYPPVWLMRQAGRALPEYRALKEKHSFLQLVQTPELAAEVTLQPIRRFDFDAAILFRDILVIPYALGREVRFEAGEGPRLDPLDTPEKVLSLVPQADFGKLEPVYEALRRVRRELD